VEPAVIATIATAGTALLSVIWTSVAARWSSRAEKEERDRLSSEVLGSSWNVLPTSADLQALEDAAPGTAARIIELAESATPAPSGPASAKPGQRVISESDTAYDKLLINDYALGLTQARRAFNVSMMFSILGGLVLVVGVALAIFRADTGGEVAGAIITSSAGVLTSGLSQLFRGQSAKALKHLEAQATELRKDVRAQTNAENAQRLLSEVADRDLRSRLQAALILQFTGAALPDLGTGSKPSADLNGSSVRSHDLTETD
jgi:Cyanobacterial TRADD-N associated 2-Transmembrane domain